MESSKSPRPKPTTRVDVEIRGRALQHRFRVAGYPHYTRWFVEYEPKWLGDSSRASRIQMLFNGRGSMADVDLLQKCEALADRYLGTQQAAA